MFTPRSNLFDRTFLFDWAILRRTDGLPVEEGRKVMHDLFSSGIPAWLYPRTDHIVSFAPFNNLPTQYRITIDGQQKWFGQ
jgi:hypothetical protein